MKWEKKCSEQVKTLDMVETWQDGKRVHCKYLPLSHTKP